MSATASSTPEERRVTGLVAGMRATFYGAGRIARRSYWLSWFAWGFVFSIYLGYAILFIFLIYFPDVSSSGPGTSNLYNAPLWAGPLAYLPAAAFLAAALYEIFAGRRESREVLEGRALIPPFSPDDPDAGGWTQQAVESQKLLSHAQSETEFSFLPITLGMLGVGSGVGIAVSALVGSASFGFELASIVFGLVLLGAIAYPLYLIAHGSIGRLQARLDRQVRGVSELEERFLAQFTGTPT